MSESATLEIKPISEHPDSGKNWIHVWTICLDSILEPVEQQSRLLDHYEIERAKRFRFNSLRTRYINRWAAYRRILATYTNDPPAKLAIERTPQGRPCLPAHAIEFSTSSSTDIAVAAVSSDQVGIDIEKENELMFSDIRTADSFLSPTESEYLQTVNPAQRWKFLIDCWTLKEAYLKGLGTGLLTDPRSVTLDLENKILVSEGGGPAKGSWKLHQPDLMNCFSVAIASAQPEAEIKFFNIKDLPKTSNT